LVLDVVDIYIDYQEEHNFTTAEFIAIHQSFLRRSWYNSQSNRFSSLSSTFQRQGETLDERLVEIRDGRETRLGSIIR
jgi:hypothetical protein